MSNPGPLIYIDRSPEFKKLSPYLTLREIEVFGLLSDSGVELDASRFTTSSPGSIGSIAPDHPVGVTGTVGFSKGVHMPEITRRKLIRAAVATGAAFPLLKLSGTEAAAAPSRGGRGGIVITPEDERVFARKLVAFETDLSEVELALLRLVTDSSNYRDDRKTGSGQSEPESFSGTSKTKCLCTVSYDDPGGFYLQFNKNCPVPNHASLAVSSD